MKYTKQITVFLFLVSFGIHSCNTQNKEVEKEVKFEIVFDTAYFDNLFELYKDSSFTEFVINREFSLIGEGGFLDSAFYDSYFIFTITENWELLKIL